MSTYTLTLNSRTSTSIKLDVYWKPDVSFYYYALIERGSTRVTPDFGGGRLTANTAYNDTADFTGFASNTEYSFSGSMYYSDTGNANDWHSGGATAQTSFVTYPASPTSVNASLSGTTLTVTWNQNKGGNEDVITNKVQIIGANISSQSFSSVTSGTATFDVSGLSAGTYTVRVYADTSATNTDNATNTIYDYTTFTKGSSGTDAISNVQANPSYNSVTISWTWSMAHTSNYYYQGLVVLKTSQIGNVIDSASTSVINGSSTPYNFSVSFTGLSEDTTYWYEITMKGGEYQNSLWNTGVTSGVLSFTTLTSGTPPSTQLLPWSWTRASGSWTSSDNYFMSRDHAQALTRSYNACNSNGETTNFSHTIWNDLLYWITDCMDTLGVSYNSTTYANARMENGSDYTLTASKWNGLVALWNRLLDTGLSGSMSDWHMNTVSTGDTVYASYFVGANSFPEIMNGYIDEYNDGYR